MLILTSRLSSIYLYCAKPKYLQTNDLKSVAITHDSTRLRVIAIISNNRGLLDDVCFSIFCGGIDLLWSRRRWRFFIQFSHPHEGIHELTLHLWIFCSHVWIIWIHNLRALSRIINIWRLFSGIFSWVVFWIIWLFQFLHILQVYHLRLLFDILDFFNLFFHGFWLFRCINERNDLFIELVGQIFEAFW